MKTLEKIQMVIFVCTTVYMVLAFGITTLNVFVEMPMLGPAMLLVSPIVVIVEYLVYIMVFGFVYHEENEEGR